MTPRSPLSRLALAAVGVVAAAWLLAGGATAQDTGFGLGERGEQWGLSFGGRLYDMWWVMLGVYPPDSAHPAYPEAGAQRGWTTWRCVTCHGWDYRGAVITDAQGAPVATIKGIDGMAGQDPAEIAAIVRDETHRFSADMIPDSALEKLALFVSRGQHDVDAVFGRDGGAKGEAGRARALFDGVCANCHAADGSAFIHAEEGDVPTLGWVARNKPYQALHKIRNGQPGADMLALRFLDMKAIADLMAYLQRLEGEPRE